MRPRATERSRRTCHAERHPSPAPVAAPAAEPVDPPTDDDAILCFSKRGDGADGDDVVIVVVNLDPHAARETLVHLDMPALGFEWYDSFLVDDEISGPSWRWGEHNYVRLDPTTEPVATSLSDARPRPTRCRDGEDADPMWFKRAVFYEVLVRSFMDSNGDGIGDFRGLREKLDYLEWLGVDCLWIPPFFTSPLRDGGYDVADYTQDPARGRHARRLPGARSTPPTSAASRSSSTS